MGIFKQIRAGIRHTREAERNSRRERALDENAFARCRPGDLVLDGPRTRLLAAYARLLGLKYRAEWSRTDFGLGVEVALTAETEYWESAVDVFRHGCAASVSGMREYTQDAGPDTVEEFSRKMLGESIGPGLYIRAMKGGEGYVVAGPGKLVRNPDFVVDELPASEEELMLRLAAAGIDLEKCVPGLEAGRD